MFSSDYHLAPSPLVSSSVSIERLAPEVLELVQRCFPRDGLQFLAWLCRLATEKQDQLFAGQSTAVAVICVQNMSDLVDQMGNRWSREATMIRLQILEALTVLTRFRQSRHTHIHLPLGPRVPNWNEILTRLTYYPSTHRKTYQQVTRIRQLLASASVPDYLTQEKPFSASSALILLRQSDVVTLVQDLLVHLQGAGVTSSQQEHIATWLRQTLLSPHHSQRDEATRNERQWSQKSPLSSCSEEASSAVRSESRPDRLPPFSPGVKRRENRQSRVEVVLPERLLAQKSSESRIDSSFFPLTEEQKESDIEFDQNKRDNGDFQDKRRSVYPSTSHTVAESREEVASHERRLDHPSLDPALGTHHGGVSHQEEGDVCPESRLDGSATSHELAKNRESRLSSSPTANDTDDAYDALLAEATVLWTRLYTEEQRQIPEGPALIWGFITRLQEHPELVRAAMINTLLQHSFPDRHGPPSDAGARWFYRTYARYVQGNLPLSPEIESWLQTDASYTQIEEALAAEHRRQQRQWLAPIRPFASCLTTSTALETDERQKEQGAMTPVTRRSRRQRQSYINDNPLPSDPDQGHANPASSDTASLPLVCVEDPLMGWCDLAAVHWWAERLQEQQQTQHWSISICVTQHERYVLHICSHEEGCNTWLWGSGRQVRTFLEERRERNGTNGASGLPTWSSSPTAQRLKQDEERE